MLNPLRHLKGRLNHIRLPGNQVLRLIQIANLIQPTAHSLSQDDSVTVDSINALKSNQKAINERSFHRFEFEYMVHSQNAHAGLPSTVLDQLTAHERKVSHTITSFADTLNIRQLLYLNFALRNRINNEYPNWKKLHLTPECPFKVEMEVLPSLTAASRVPQLRALKKVKVMKAAIKAKQ